MRTLYRMLYQLYWRIIGWWIEERRVTRTTIPFPSKQQRDDAARRWANNVAQVTDTMWRAASERKYSQEFIDAWNRGPKHWSQQDNPDVETDKDAKS